MELLATDISRVQTQLSVAKQQLESYQVGMDNEQKSREALEGKWQHLQRKLASLRSKRSLREDQLKAVQQNNEDVAQTYQQREVFLQRSLINEEMDLLRQTLASASKQQRLKRCKRQVVPGAGGLVAGHVPGHPACPEGRPGELWATN